MTTPTASVVIPTYNRARLLEVAIGSVLAQTWSDLEVIVVDDDSQDDTSAIVGGLQDRRLKYIKHSSNRGGSAARNTGIRAAQGHYVAFLDDDDRWLENKTEEQLRAIGDCDAVLCGFYDGSTGKARALDLSEVKLRHLRRGNPFAGSGLLVRANVIKEEEFDEHLPNGQDWDVLVRLASKYKIAYLPKPLFIFNTGGHNRISTATRDMALEQLEKRLLSAGKHKELLGSFWFNYRSAFQLLTYIGLRSDKARRIRYVINRCGLLPTLRVLADKILVRVVGH